MSVAAQASSLPEGVLLAYYGDDFTGSTDAMEVMSFAGLPTVLFTDIPTQEQLARFSGYRAVGIAGVARSRNPAWMERHLPDYFRALASLEAPIVQYKVCSTFDSAPHLGSIGKAIEIGLAEFGPSWSPIVVGAPRLGRHQAFGNLFASVDGEGFRLDRHPTMSRHPVTPMPESDLRRHLAAQTSLPIGLVDFVALKAGEARRRLEHELAKGVRAVLVDVLDDETLAEAGGLVWHERGKGVFGASSSGLQYALIAHWRASGALPAAVASPPIRAVDRIAVASGSCSPATARQVAWAEAHGFATVRLAVDALVDPARRREEIERAAVAALAVLDSGRDPIVLTATGPDDPSIARFEALTRDGDRESAQISLGEALGHVLAILIDRGGVRRVVVAGGDSAGRAVSRLGIDALTAIAPLAPGAPLCRAWSDDPTREGLEITLKGGQVGDAAFFGTAKTGRTLQ